MGSRQGDRAGELVLRPSAWGRWAYALDWALVMGIPGLVLVLFLAALWPSSTGFAWAFVLLAVADAIVTVRAAHAQVRFGDTAVTVVTPLRTVRLAWHDIREITFAPRSSEGALLVPGPNLTWLANLGLRELVLHTATGRQIIARASGRASLVERDRVRVLATAHGIPVNELA